MRGKLNSNPIAQLALIGVLVAGAAFLLLKGGGGGSEEGAAVATSTTAQATSGKSSASPGASSGSAGGETATVSAGAAASSVEAGASETASSALPVSVPHASLPAAVSDAYKHHKIVVLLVVRSAGIDDRAVRSNVDLLKELHKVVVNPAATEDQVVKADHVLKAFRKLAVFVVSANRIANYSAITVGAEVQQVPALVVVRPRSLSGGTPQASVSYGFQTPQSALQAIIDATYKGPEVPYHPH
jgi:hypothetical protein